MSTDLPHLPRLPRRAPDAHKGTFGTVAVVGGSDDGQVRMVGAPALAGLAALRGGAGLVRLVMPEPLLTAGLTICTGATGIPMPWSNGGTEAHEAAAVMDRVIEVSTVLAVGPGLGTSPGAVAATLRAMQQEDLPVVLDADGINALCGVPEFYRDLRAAAVLTPHPGEFRRLCAAMRLKSELGLDSSRERACEQMAQRLGRVVVLKGAGTVVSDGLRTWTCPAGHPCLGTAGTGDVLTGVIAALVAQFVPSVQVAVIRSKVPQMPRPTDRPLDLFDAARAGVLAHARGGERWAQSRGASAGLLASELADLIPEQIESLRATP